MARTDIEYAAEQIKDTLKNGSKEAIAAATKAASDVYIRDGRPNKRSAARLTIARPQ